ETNINMNYKGERMKVGVGIHVSSAALLLYVMSLKYPFILVSTGTWSIALNPFTTTPLSEKEVSKNCINYMRINGKQVKASRLFLGNEYKIKVQKLAEHYGVERDQLKFVRFNEQAYYE